jgi:hypothetical protein
MAGIEFDREAFVPISAPQERSIARLLSPILFLFAISLVAFVGYKIYAATKQDNAVAAANTEVQQLQQRLAEMQTRLDQLDKRHKATSTTASVASPDKPASSQSSGSPAKKTIYSVTSASALPPQAKPAAPANTSSLASAPSRANSNNAIASEVTASREAWQATTNRLSDVVGVVGTQQEEINATREAVNQLLTQTHRQVVSFELGRGYSRLPLGPVTLQFKSADPKSQHYTLCVYFEKKCIELKDRALNEVVVFVVTKDHAPLELVATKIQHDQIVGYLEVPSKKQ